MLKCPKSLPHQASGMRVKGALKRLQNSGFGLSEFEYREQVLLKLGIEGIEK